MNNITLQYVNQFYLRKIDVNILYNSRLKDPYLNRNGFL